MKTWCLLGKRIVACSHWANRAIGKATNKATCKAISKVVKTVISMQLHQRLKELFLRRILELKQQVCKRSRQITAHSQSFNPKRHLFQKIHFCANQGQILNRARLCLLWRLRSGDKNFYKKLKRPNTRATTFHLWKSVTRFIWLLWTKLEKRYRWW